MKKFIVVMIMAMGLGSLVGCAGAPSGPSIVEALPACTEMLVKANECYAGLTTIEESTKVLKQLDEQGLITKPEVIK